MTFFDERRRFLQAGGLALAGVAASTLAGSLTTACGAESGRRIKKAFCWEMFQEKLSLEDKFRAVKDVGFDGVEVNCRVLKTKGVKPQDFARASQKIGVPIHGVSGVMNGDICGLLNEATIYGANTILHVVRTDPKGSYLENYRLSQEAIRKAIPCAEKTGVTILVENVWASFLIEPMGMARYLDELNSPFVKAYFDVGNVMRWGLPEQWVEVLGKRIGKIHVKEYSLKTAMAEGMWKGFNFPMGQGDINWKRVFEELRKVDFHTWATAEVKGGDRKRLAEVSAEMDRILAA